MVFDMKMGGGLSVGKSEENTRQRVLPGENGYATPPYRS